MLARTTLSLLAAVALLTACGPKIEERAQTAPPAPVAPPPASMEVPTPAARDAVPAPSEPSIMGTDAAAAAASATSTRRLTREARQARAAERAGTPAAAVVRTDPEWSSDGSRDLWSSEGSGRTGGVTVRQSAGAGGLGASGFGGAPGSDRRGAETNTPRP